MALGWPLVRTASLVALGLFVLVFATTNPRGAATAAVFVGWLFAIPAMDLAYPQSTMTAVVTRLAALVLLGIVVIAVAYLIRAYPPWRTALMAFLAAGVLGSLVVLIFPSASVVPTYAIAGAVLAYRAIAARWGLVPWSRKEAGRVADDEPRSEEADDEEISVEGALAELDAMIGLDPVKRQVRAIAASIEAARLRAQAGYLTEKPMRHLVFVGPPGTGKTTVARTVARIFYAFGLLDRTHVVEAHRADLVGEYLGATAQKTNQLVDSALGGVLFIDEAYGLVTKGEGPGEGGSDRFGAEAVQTLLKRAEDDREDVVIILAGYEREMEDFLASNPGLNSRFATRVTFPSYSPDDLRRIAEYHVVARGDRLHPDALDELQPLFEGVHRRGIVDDLGNGRFVRSLVEAAATARDVRVVENDATPTSEDLVTILPGDVEKGYAEITARFRGYADPPSLEDALAELDAMVGLEPVKRQVRALAAQLRVGRVRREQGISAAPPMRHFVFTGPPGTGKTTVARILGRVFAALGLLARPDVVEGSRVDLVGEYLGQTAVKTNKLVDKAVGGVLFIDEAYSLAGEGYSGGDAFGAEAVSTLLKRAEDDRHKLVIVLAGYSHDMERFLARNQGLASRFATRVAFPSYGPEDLREIALRQVAAGGDAWDAAAEEELGEVFEAVSERGLVDELGNGRFVRSLYEKAAAARDLRLAEREEDVTPAELTTLTAPDVREAYSELAGRFPEKR